MEALARWLGAFLAPILTPIIKDALNDFFQGRSDVSKPNANLERVWAEGDVHSTGRNNDSTGRDKERKD